MLARKVVTRSGRKIRGYFPSRKMERMIEWESLLERDAILLMEFSSGIKYYREQPERIVYYADQEQREYYPDFEISLFGDSVAHIEVKPFAQLQRRKVSDKLSHVLNHYERLGRQFLVLTDERIRRQPLLNNLSRLQYFNRPGYPIDGVRERYYWRFGNAATTFAEAITELGESAVMTLLAYGVLSCDLEQPYASANVIVWKEDGDATILL
jgi:hypothetical protein